MMVSNRAHLCVPTRALRAANPAATATAEAAGAQSVAALGAAACGRSLRRLCLEGLWEVASRRLELPPVATRAQLVGFAGDQTNYNISAPHFRWTGHVGLRFRAEEATLYGFTPDTELRHDTPLLVSTLLDGNRFTGRVADDYEDFADATQSPFGQIFVFWDIPDDLCTERDCGWSLVQQDAAGRGSAKFYAFPPEAPRKYRGHTESACDELWGKNCFNCATYPKSVGLPIPDESGMLPGYLEELAKAPASLCRCYTFGRWRSSRECSQLGGSHEALRDLCHFEEPEEKSCGVNLTFDCSVDTPRQIRARPARTLKLWHPQLRGPAALAEIRKEGSRPRAATAEEEEPLQEEELRPSEEPPLLREDKEPLQQKNIQQEEEEPLQQEEPLPQNEEPQQQKEEPLQQKEPLQQDEETRQQKEEQPLQQEEPLQQNEETRQKKEEPLQQEELLHQEEERLQQKEEREEPLHQEEVASVIKPEDQDSTPVDRKEPRSVEVVSKSADEEDTGANATNETEAVAVSAIKDEKASKVAEDAALATGQAPPPVPPPVPPDTGTLTMAASGQASEEAEDALAANLSKLTQKAIEKLDTQLQDDYKAVKEATGSIQKTRSGLTDGLHALDKSTEHLQAQIPRETVPPLQKIQQALREGGKEKPLPSPSSPGTATSKTQEQVQDKSANEDLEENEPTGPKTQETETPQVEDKDAGTNEAPLQRSPDLVEDDDAENAAKDLASSCPRHGDPKGYELVAKGFWSPRSILAINASLSQCAQLCRSAQKARCDRFSFQALGGECSISTSGSKNLQLVKTDFCIFAFQKVKSAPVTAPTAGAAKAATKVEEEVTSPSATAEKEHVQKALAQAPQSAAPVKPKTSPSKKATEPQVVAKEAAKEQNVAHDSPGKQKSPYCTRHYEGAHAEDVRKQLCKLLEELNSLQRGVLEGSSTPSQERNPRAGRREPDAAEQDAAAGLIAEPTLGTDAEQDEEVAEAQAAAFHKADHAEILKTVQVEPEAKGHLPGGSVLKLKDPQKGADSEPWDGGPYKELAPTTPQHPADEEMFVPPDAAAGGASSSSAGASKLRFRLKELERSSQRQAHEVLKEAQEDTEQMVETAETGAETGAALKTSDQEELQKLIDQLAAKLEEVEKDPGFSSHQVVHHVRSQLPPLKEEVKSWTEGSLLQRFHVLKEVLGGFQQRTTRESTRPYKVRAEQYFSAGPAW
ncbi:Reticulocyte-binding protein 2 homolog a [Durusdinium trenchii]|uniref:Reticulocyte-binding protein 2 homolog a n=1 Tax=Durusdinium trenchii TaxID=1381693 RepID=A0ABP0KIH9_9DINO